ncbi:uncharacterized protein BDV14DRAFT_39998 [Aspergillus stella-maris]|uniref:uncharacterized protein n=1 Tax=Aspergillus stella-maris TaxID=1810926 RepID=UPI003CCD285C
MAKIESSWSLDSRRRVGGLTSSTPATVDQDLVRLIDSEMILFRLRLVPPTDQGLTIPGLRGLRILCKLPSLVLFWVLAFVLCSFCAIRPRLQACATAR